MRPEELKSMIADYMERGFLENIIDMFKHDKSLYPLFSELLKDERVGVRLGASVLVETLNETDNEGMQSAAHLLLPLLMHSSPVVRGDAAYVAGVIRYREALSCLHELAEGDPNADVRLIASEAIEDIIGKH